MSELQSWQKKAEFRLQMVLKSAAEYPALKLAKVRLHVPIGIVSAPQMSQLNRKFRGKKGPTDVLSFEAPPAFRKLGLLGEIVVCLPVLEKQARALKHPAQRELDVLLIHGVLHLLGFDHETSKASAARMARWELKLLKKLDPKASTVKGLIGRQP